MKNFLLLILCILTAISSVGQSKSNSYLLTLDFWPAFEARSQLSVEAKGDSAFLTIRINQKYRPKEISIENKVGIPAGKLTALTDFLKSYKFRIKENGDTVGSHKEFIKGDSVLVYDVERGSDGIDVTGLFSQNEGTNKFAFWSPNKGTENAKLMALLFDLIDYAFTGPRIVNYVEQLQQYFPHKLGLKKLSDKPLIYKLFGDISEDEANQFYVFLKNLPRREKVIIDMSNYSGMGTMFYDAFEEYHAIRKNIYWRNPTSQGLIDLYKSGVPYSQVITGYD